VHRFPIRVFAIEVWLAFVFAEVTATFEGDGFF
jgi:hypothetical protein